MVLDPKGGDHYVVREPFEAIVLVQFFAPLTDGARRVLPSGLEFTIWGDPVPEAVGVSARPVDPARWEQELVSAENLRDEKYGGYSFSVNKADLASRCAKVA